MVWASISCKSEKSQTSFYRFIDLLTEKNIAASPLKDLSKKFPKYEQKLEKGWMNLSRILKTEGYDVWGISTHCPVLEINDEIHPQNIKIFEGEAEVPYLEQFETKDKGWRWKKGQERVKYVGC